MFMSSRTKPKLQIPFSDTEFATISFNILYMAPSKYQVNYTNSSSHQIFEVWMCRPPTFYNTFEKNENFKQKMIHYMNEIALQMITLASRHTHTHTLTTLKSHNPYRSKRETRKKKSEIIQKRTMIILLKIKVWNNECTLCESCRMS